MRHVTFGMFPVLALLLNGVCAGRPAGAEAKLIRLPESLQFVRGRVPDGGPGWKTYLFGVKEPAGGPAVAKSATAYPDYLSVGRHLGTDLLVRYPDLRKGDLVPVFGQLYKVEMVGGGAMPAMTMRKVPADKAPKGARIPAHSLSIPLLKDKEGGARLHDAGVRVLAIEPPKGPGGKMTARVEVQHYIKGVVQRVTEEATVKEGDLVLLSKAAHKVLSVVPPDPKTRVIGWVALDPDPIPEAELIKKKLPFVRPARP